MFGAKNGTRTRDPDLGKVVLYQLSYFRNMYLLITRKLFFIYFLAKVGTCLIFWGKVVLYQLSYFRNMYLLITRKLFFIYFLAKVGTCLIFWGKVVLYQLSYFRNMYLLLASLCQACNFSIAVQR